MGKKQAGSPVNFGYVLAEKIARAMDLSSKHFYSSVATLSSTWHSSVSCVCRPPVKSCYSRTRCTLRWEETYERLIFLFECCDASRFQSMLSVARRLCHFILLPQLTARNKELALIATIRDVTWFEPLIEFFAQDKKENGWKICSIELRGMYNTKNQNTISDSDVEKLLVFFPETQEIILSCASVTDECVKHLRKFDTLYNLTFSVCNNLHSVAALSGAPVLRKLRFDGCPDVRTIGAALGNLEILSFEGSRGVNNAAKSIRNCPSIKEFDATSTDLSSDGAAVIFPLLTKLETLKLNRTLVVELPVMTHLKHLAQINLRDTKIRAAGLSKKLPQSLTDLCIAQTQVDSLEFLADCPNLKVLDLKSTPIGNAAFKGVSFLPKLQSLTIAYCSNVSDLGPLRGCSALRFIDCWGSGINNESVEVLATLVSLEDIEMVGCNNVTDVSCLDVLPSLTKLDVSFYKSRINLGALAEKKGLELLV